MGSARYQAMARTSPPAQAETRAIISKLDHARSVRHQAEGRQLMLMPPRDPNDDDEDEDENENEDQRDDEPAVIREPDEGE